MTVLLSGIIRILSVVINKSSLLLQNFVFLCSGFSEALSVCNTSNNNISISMIEESQVRLIIKNPKSGVKHIKIKFDSTGALVFFLYLS